MFIASLYNLKGGVGKTASCVNFAYMAAKDGFKTLLWDLDPQGAASFYYNAEAHEKGSAKKLMRHELSLDEVITETQYEHLDIIPADISARNLDLILDDEGASKKYIKKLLKELKHDYDFVFIDCPPGFSILADNIFEASDAILMPVIPTTLSVRTYEMVKNYFKKKEIDKDKLMCFFSMVDLRKKMHSEAIETLLQDKRFFEYYIPYLSDIEKMGIHHAPVEEYATSSYATICYRALWGEIKEGVVE